MMKKRIVALLVTALLIASLLIPAVAEACNYNTNRNYRLVKTMVATANNKIDTLVLIAKITPYDDVDWLLWQVNQIANSTIRSARLLGYEVKCEYETHIIDGRRVEIDPLYVINPLPDNADGDDGDD